MLITPIHKTRFTRGARERNYRSHKLAWVALLAMICSACQNPGLQTPKTVPGSTAASQASTKATPASVIRYNTIHHPVIASDGMVVSQNAIATRIGQQVLADGGNAVDAATAVAFALAVTLPRAGNIGGSGYMLIHLAESGENIALDYRSMAPLSASLDRYRDAASADIDWDAMTRGARASGVPGTVAAVHLAWQRYGSLPWAQLLAPARALAQDGIVVTEDLAFALRATAPVLAQFPSSAAAYLREDNTAPIAGEQLRQPDLAWSIEQIMAHGADAFYRGAVAQRIVAAMAAAGGSIDAADLAAYRVRERAAVTTQYRGHTVVAAPLSSAGGVTLMQMLNVLSHFNLKQMGAGSARSLHVLAETMKRAYANRRAILGDPDFVSIPLQVYLGAALAQAMASDIDLGRAARVSDIQAWSMEPQEGRDTTHFSVMDAAGNAVSNTYTLGYSFGSGFVAEGTGILFDNQIRNFSHRTDQDHPNAMAPGKRMLSTMTPTMVMDPQGQVLLVTGTPGGSRIINVILQLIVNVVDHGMNVAQATHQPRIHQDSRAQVLGIEYGMNADTTALLEQLGHEVEFQQTMGSTQSILQRDGFFFGAADPRRPGALALGLDARPSAP